MVAISCRITEKQNTFDTSATQSATGCVIQPYTTSLYLSLTTACGCWVGDRSSALVEGYKSSVVSSLQTV